MSDRCRKSDVLISFARTAGFPGKASLPIEILGAMIEEACLKKGEKKFQLISTLFCKEKRGFVGP
jgi:hypothetical protein